MHTLSLSTLNSTNNQMAVLLSSINIGTGLWTFIICSIIKNAISMLTFGWSLQGGRRLSITKHQFQPQGNSGHKAWLCREPCKSAVEMLRVLICILWVCQRLIVQNNQMAVLLSSINIGTGLWTFIIYIKSHSKAAFSLPSRENVVF